MDGKTKPSAGFSLFLLVLLHRLFLCAAAGGEGGEDALNINVGVILDLDMPFGKVINRSISMARDDYAANNKDSRTSLGFQLRHIGKSPGAAASAALDLLKTTSVQAIIVGAETSEEADFLAYVANQARVPIISLSTDNSLLSATDTPYFISMSSRDSSQIGAITAVMKAYGWGTVILVHDESSGFIPYFTYALQRAGVQVIHRALISAAAADIDIRTTLRRLSSMNTGIFIVHLSPALGSRFFLSVQKLGMMSSGYAWMVTPRLANVLQYLGPSVVNAMKGVLGVKTHLHSTPLLRNWRNRMKRLYPETAMSSDIDVFGPFAYDATWMIAKAANHVASSRSTGNTNFSSARITENADRLLNLRTSPVGEILSTSILSSQSRGLIGEIRFADRQLASPNTLEIVNVMEYGRSPMVGIWTTEFGLCHVHTITSNFTCISKLSGVVWPGGTANAPRGGTDGAITKVLKIGVPVKRGFLEFVKVLNPNIGCTASRSDVTGFPVDVFREVMSKLEIQSYVFCPYTKETVEDPDYYNNLVDAAATGEYDAVVGDITIRANRSNVDFSQPYVEAGVSMVVPAENGNDFREDAWWFFKPLALDLWVASVGMFLLKGVLVWFFERGTNKEFQGTLREQAGKILYYSFSTFVFANRETLERNYSRFVMSVWTFVVFILVTAYGANLTSKLTVEQLRPRVTDLETLIRRGDSIGYQNGSFVGNFLLDKGAKKSQLRAYSNVAEYEEALFKGSNRGGVSAIVDEIPFISVFLKGRKKNYTMAGRVYKTGGFGFVFPKGSSLVNEVSNQVLYLNQQDEICRIERSSLGSDACSNQVEPPLAFYKLHLYHFRSIYCITLAVSVATLIAYLLHSWRNGNSGGGSGVGENPPVDQWLELGAAVLAALENGGIVHGEGLRSQEEEGEVMPLQSLVTERSSEAVD